MTFAVHHSKELNPDTGMPDPHQDTYSKNVLGFWMYLMSDCVLFATLFTTYAVLHHATFGGPSGKDIFDLTTTFAETMILLFSSITAGFAVLASLKKANVKYVIPWLIATFILGALFLGLELHEFITLAKEGHTWEKSAFLSSFFTLVGTHGLHITVGLLWIVVLAIQIWFLGIDTNTFRRLVLFNMFWHFLDLIWIFIFTLVYLIGVL